LTVVVVSVVGRRCRRFFFGEYFQKLMIFQRNWVFAGLGGFLDFADVSLAYFPWVHFANLSIFRCFPVVLLRGLFFRDRVCSW